MQHKDKGKKSQEKRHLSVDGFFSSNPTLDIGATFNKAQKRGQKMLHLGSFDRSRKEGFYTNSASPHSISDSKFDPLPVVDDVLSDDAIEIDNENPIKKRFSWIKLPRFKKRETPLTKRMILKRAVLVVLLLVVVGGGFLGFKFYKSAHDILRGGAAKAPGLGKNVDVAQLKGEGDGRVNILLLGIGGDGHDGPNLSDTMMLASIDPVNKTATLLSIPRDLYVKIPGYGTSKINAAFAYGKEYSKSDDFATQNREAFALVDQTLSPILGVNIHYHAVVDFTAFKEAVDTVGGVTVDVPETLYDPFVAWENNWNPTIAKPGVQTFNGQKALLYVRSRETSSDFARAERQRLVIAALKDKVLSIGTFGNPIKMAQLATTFGNHVFSDMGIPEAKRLYEIGSQIPSSGITSLDFVTPPHAYLTTGNMNGLSIVQPRAGLNQYDEMKAFVKSSLVDGFILKESPKVAVFNGTGTAGLATSQATILKNYGYNVVSTGDEPTKSADQATILVDLSGGNKRYTKHYLEARYATKAVSAVPASSGITTTATDADFVIILGKDAATNSQN